MSFIFFYFVISWTWTTQNTAQKHSIIHVCRRYRMLFSFSSQTREYKNKKKKIGIRPLTLLSAHILFIRLCLAALIFFFFCSFPSNSHPYYIEWRERSGTVRNTLTYSRQELNTLFIFVVKLTRLLFGMWQDASQTKLKNNQEQSTLTMAAVVCEKTRLMDIFILFFIRAPWFRSNAANNKAKKKKQIHHTCHIPKTINQSIPLNRIGSNGICKA